jgi:excisionase family DNA binding protein
MKSSDLSVKELATFIGVSTDSIRRAVRKGEIPATRVKTALRFDLQEVLTCLRRNAVARFGEVSPARRTAEADRAQAVPPPSSKTGAQFLGNGS